MKSTRDFSNESLKRMKSTRDFSKLVEQKEAFLAGGLVRDAFSDEERKQYNSLSVTENRLERVSLYPTSYDVFLWMLCI